LWSAIRSLNRICPVKNYNNTHNFLYWFDKELKTLYYNWGKIKLIHVHEILKKIMTTLIIIYMSSYPNTYIDFIWCVKNCFLKRIAFDRTIIDNYYDYTEIRSVINIRTFRYELTDNIFIFKLINVNIDAPCLLNCDFLFGIFDYNNRSTFLLYIKYTAQIIWKLSNFNRICLYIIDFLQI